MVDERVWLLWQQVIAGINVSYGGCILAGQCGVLQVSGDSEDQRVSQEYFMSHRTARVRLAGLHSERQHSILENIYYCVFTGLVFTDGRNRWGLCFPMYQGCPKSSSRCVLGHPATPARVQWSCWMSTSLKFFVIYSRKMIKYSLRGLKE